MRGAHLNPAVTLAQAIFRGFPLDEVLLYWVSQLLGAFVGAVIVFIINYHGFQIADRSSTIGIFVTGLQTDSVSTAAAFGAEFFGTAFLMLVILATSDEGNSPAGNIQPLIIGLLIVALINSFGYQSGCALNPARDLAPRVFIALAGWGTEAFTRQAYYFWVPIVAPFAGAIAGALSYDVLVYSSRPSPLSN
ncbi:hypothetical protein BGZ99_002160 [Dissophora globulifera]|uniref:Aquaporin n=1 Tax=Dissophora globulifera TaxID=979702 RepID=A0A9P6RSR1_9FUNG|nr:hypothetical protein BGZ99_002160 [Dissophora globulifera]